jgi:hypothetical protein
MADLLNLNTPSVMPFSVMPFPHQVLFGAQEQVCCVQPAPNMAAFAYDFETKATAAL